MDATTGWCSTSTPAFLKEHQEERVKRTARNQSVYSHFYHILPIIMLLSTVGIIRQGNDLANRCHGFSLAIHRSEKLVGGFNPLKNDGVSWDDVYSQYMGKW